MPARTEALANVLAEDNPIVVIPDERHFAYQHSNLGRTIRSWINYKGEGGGRGAQPAAR
jgi:hypothetical protein